MVILEARSIITKPFAEIVGGSRSPSIVLKPPGVYRGEPATFFSKEDIANLLPPFQFTLVGKFSHGRPSLKEIHSALNSIVLKAAFMVGMPCFLLISANPSIFMGGGDFFEGFHSTRGSVA